VRPYLQKAREKRYLFIFVILDPNQSIVAMRSVEKESDGGVKLVPYLKDFPFDYYTIVSDLH